MGPKTRSYQRVSGFLQRQEVVYEVVVVALLVVNDPRLPDPRSLGPRHAEHLALWLWSVTHIITIIIVVVVVVFNIIIIIICLEFAACLYQESLHSGLKVQFISINLVDHVCMPLSLPISPSLSPPLSFSLSPSLSLPPPSLSLSLSLSASMVCMR